MATLLAQKQTTLTTCTTQTADALKNVKKERNENKKLKKKMLLRGVRLVMFHEAAGAAAGAAKKSFRAETTREMQKTPSRLAVSFLSTMHC